MSGPRTGERGAAAVELAVIVPVLVFMLGLMVAGGRVWFARATVTEAAASAARSASMARSPGEASSSARQAASASLSTAGLRCASTSISVDTGGFAVEVGRPASVSAAVTCLVSFGDLTLPGTPGSLRLHAERSSALDTYRSRR